MTDLDCTGVTFTRYASIQMAFTVAKRSDQPVMPLDAWLARAPLCGCFGRGVISTR
jgi:hypothetical protein